jgi:glycosyltransferase involved in cell wall biosynthesis
MIKVLHIHTMPIISGSGINTFLSMRGMDKALYDTELLCAPGGPLIELVRGWNMKVRTLKSLVQPLNPIKDLSALTTMTFFLKHNPYHIVHTHNSKAGFLGRLAAKLAGIPVIVHTVHGFAFHAGEPSWRQWLFKTLERTASRWCDKMIFISQPLIDWGLRERVASEKKTVKIYSGIELDRFNPVSKEVKESIREKWGIARDDAVIGIVSKLWDGKGHLTLIKAFKMIRSEIENARLVIVGEGYLYNHLVKFADSLGLKDAVLFIGFQSDVSESIASFDVAVLPSFFEGMGRVLLEAMAMEKPVVASRVGGIPDLVEHGVNGFLVTPGDVGGLADAITRILCDKGLAQKMGKAGRKKISDKYSADQMVGSIEKLYRDLLAMKGIQFEH